MNGDRRMAKKVTVTDPTTKQDYIIEFDRDSVVYAESIGFDVTKAATAYATDMVTLFRAGFHKNHPFVSKEVVYGIWDRVKDKQGLFGLLMDMFMVPYNALVDEPKDGDKGNVTWEATE